MRTMPLILCLGFLPAAAGQDKGIERTLLDRSMQQRRVLLTAIDAGTITYSEGGLLRTEPTSEYLAILPLPKATAAQQGTLPGNAPPPEARTAPRYPSLELVDGQRLTGTLAGPTPSGDGFAWAHPLLGTVQLSTDDALRIRFRKGPDTQPAPASDVVLLANGDRLEGFIESVADPLVLSLDQQKRQVPLDRAAEILFANPPQAPRGTFVWLSDGSVIAARELRTNRVGELLLTPRLASDSESPEMERSPGAAAMPLDSLQAANFDIAALSPLGALSPEQQLPLGDRRWTQPIALLNQADAPLSAPDILLPGPMQVRWPLPESALRLAATAELPRHDWTWGDCELVVQVAMPGAEPREMLRQRLTGESPSAPVNIDLGSGAGRTLIVRLEPGALGPIEDRIILRLPLLAATPAQD